jgi:apolipoprotein N-acyltransferase
MAKKHKIPTLALFIAGSIILSLAWLMPSFPLLAFFGIAPFIAIAVNNRKEKSMWTSLELVLLGLTIAFFSATMFNDIILAYTIALAIAFTMPFLGYTFVRKTLGPGASIITIGLFWLAIEYLLLKWDPDSSIFLADLLSLKQEWVRWNSKTGYLGASLWILISNTLLFQAVLTEKKINWVFLVLFILSIAGPIAYSLALKTDSVTRDQMAQLYSANNMDVFSNYSTTGELIPRTSAWISVLILLFTLVKRKTARK